jgi:hypothetical protein
LTATGASQQGRSGSRCSTSSRWVFPAPGWLRICLVAGAGQAGGSAAGRMVMLMGGKLVYTTDWSACSSVPSAPPLSLHHMC